MRCKMLRRTFEEQLGINTYTSCDLTSLLKYLLSYFFATHFSMSKRDTTTKDYFAFQFTDFKCHLFIMYKTKVVGDKRCKT